MRLTLETCTGIERIWYCRALVSSGAVTGGVLHGLEVLQHQAHPPVPTLPGSLPYCTKNIERERSKSMPEPAP